MMGRAAILAAAGLSLYVLLSSGQAIRPVRPAIPDDFFGMHIIDGNTPSASFGGLRTSGVSWPRVQPSRGVFDWSRLDGQVQAASANGWKVLYTTNGVPPWAAANGNTCQQGSCTSGVARAEDWTAFVTALVQRYRGRIEAYELWNEPDQNFTGSMQEFVAMAGHFRDVVRSEDRAALVVSPAALKVDWHDTFWDAGGTRDVDAVAFHGYLPLPLPEDLQAAKTAPLEAILQHQGMASKPIWDSESSWGEPGKLTDPAGQAAYIARAYLLHWSFGLSRFYWYSWDDTSADGTAGWGALLDPKSHTPTPAAIAYQQVRAWMAGATMSTPCSGSTDATWTCGLARPGYQAMVVWNTATAKMYTPQTPGYRPPTLWNRTTTRPTAPRPLFKQYRDLAGNVRPVNGTVPIGAQPILLETAGSAQ